MQIELINMHIVSVWKFNIYIVERNTERAHTDTNPHISMERGTIQSSDRRNYRWCFFFLVRSLPLHFYPSLSMLLSLINETFTQIPFKHFNWIGKISYRNSPNENGMHKALATPKYIITKWENVFKLSAFRKSVACI